MSGDILQPPSSMGAEPGKEVPQDYEALLAERDEWHEEREVLQQLVANTQLSLESALEAKHAAEVERDEAKHQFSEERRKRSDVERSLATAAFRIVEIETENQRLEQEAQEATIDPNTRLYNKRGLEIAYDALISVWPEPEEAHIVLFIDLDNFKQYNSLIGHGKTDAFVVAISQILKAHLRGSDIMGRYGGDEFIALLPNTGKDMGRQVADRLRESIKLIKELEGHEVSPTLSVGVTSIGSHTSFLQAFEPADQAMREAKQLGRDKTIVLD